MALVGAPQHDRGQGLPARGQPLDPLEGFESKLELEYSRHLELLRRTDGDVAAWWPHPLKLLLPGTRNTYAPDFLVQRADGRLELHEVKGRWIEDARVKIRTAAGCFPVFTFVAVTKNARRDQARRGLWSYERF